jgi:heme exporter protein D
MGATMKTLVYGTSRLVFSAMGIYGVYVGITKGLYVQALLCALISALCISWLLYDMRRGHITNEQLRYNRGARERPRLHQ